MNPGYMTSYFKRSSGVRQGCPSQTFSVYTFRRNSCNEPSLQPANSQETRLAQFADDTTVILNNVESLKAYLARIK